MAGVGKRLPEVPPAVLVLGSLVSKATLLEVAYHLCLRIQEEDETRAIHELVSEIEILTRKKIRLPSKAPNFYVAQLRAILQDRT
jgi:hypothetical protein